VVKNQILDFNGNYRKKVQQCGTRLSCDNNMTSARYCPDPTAAR